LTDLFGVNAMAYEYSITDDCTGNSVKIVASCLDEVFDWMRKNCWPTEGSCLIKWESEHGSHSYR